MQKREKNKKRVALFEISNLIVSIIAFCFIISLYAEISFAATLDFKTLKPGDKLNTGWGTQEVVPTNYGLAIPDRQGNLGLLDSFPKEDIAGFSLVTAAGEVVKGTLPLAPPFSIFWPKGVPGTTWGHLAQGLSWAAAVVGVIQIAKAMGLDENIADSLSYGAGAGIMAGKIAHLLGASTGLSVGIGLGVGILIFLLTYKDEEQRAVEFACEPWQAPIRGADCEKCNEDPLKPCSEYRCKSLGQACAIVNPGTSEEKCVWVNRNDAASPTIEPWYGVLTKDHSYKDVKLRPPGTGMRIANDKSKDKECIKAFTPLQFGILTNEPARCKIDYNHTKFDEQNIEKAFNDMQYWFGETNLFLYNHTQRLSLPGPSAVNTQSPELQNDGEYTLYVRCQDANGNYNEDEFAIKFCVEKGPDETAPVIVKTSIENGMPVAYNTENVDLDVYVNEPAECKWSRHDIAYDLMENEMQCSENIWQMEADLVYKCSTKLTGVKNREDNIFFFKCKDQPWADDKDRKFNTESYTFILKGTEPLNIIHTEPNGTIQGSTDVVSVSLGVETANGYNEGDSTCYFSTTGSETDYIAFLETGTNLHKQQQDLTAGTYTYYFKCVDLGGNTDYNQATFTLKVDKQAPGVVRAYKDGNYLKVTTDEISDCRYSSQDCNFKISEGIDMPQANQTEHFVEWDATKTYYIKCSDAYNNQPLPTECSVIVRVYNKKE